MTLRTPTQALLALLGMTVFMLVVIFGMLSLIIGPNIAKCNELGGKYLYREDVCIKPDAIIELGKP